MAVSGQVNWWKINEGSGDTIIDYGSQLTDGTNVNGSWVSGGIKYDDVINFDADTDRITTTGCLTSDPLVYTVCMWVKPALLQEGIFWNSSSAEAENSMFFNGTAVYAKHYNATSGNVYAGGTSLSAGTWYFIALFFDQTNQVCGCSVDASAYTEVAKAGIKTANGGYQCSNWWVVNKFLF